MRMRSTLASIAALTIFLTAVPLAQAGTAELDRSMAPVLEQYLQIQSALAADHTKGVKAAAEKIVSLAPSLAVDAVTGQHAAHYEGLPDKIVAGAKKVAAAGDLAARAAFAEQSTGGVRSWTTGC